MRRSLFHSILICCWAVNAGAQGLDTLTIPVFEKTAALNKPSKAYFSQDFDSISSAPATAGLDLAQLLADEANVYINDYGPGALSSPSSRGGAAAQTILIWNGAKLNSPMLGTSDLSLVATDQFEQVSVFTSSASNIYSSGGIGGGIWLGNEANYNHTFAQLSLTAGSFGLFSQSLKANAVLKIRNQPMSIGLQVNQRFSENNFTYLDNSIEPFIEQRREQSAYSNFNAQLSVSSFIGKRFEYTLLYWRNQANREVPNTIKLRVPAEAEQKDTADRFQALLKFHPSKRWKLGYMAFYEENSNSYSDARIGLKNLNRFQSLQQSLDARFERRQGLAFTAVLNHNFISATSGNYDGRESQSQESLMLGAEIVVWKKTTIQPTLKAQHIEGEVYLLPNISINQAVIGEGKLELKANYAETVRLPTLNELYWKPGGNQDLKPETGRTAEVGAQSRLKGSRLMLESSLSCFRGRFENWIRWLPQGATFRPQNVLSVRQEGFDFNAALRIKTKPLFWTVSCGGVYTKITNESDGASNRLTYVPDFQFHAAASVKWRAYSLRYVHNYMGPRYITSDNRQYMPQYQIGRLALSSSFFTQKKVQAGVALGVDNLWNENYQVIAWRPMPKRSFFVNLQIRWEK